MQSEQINELASALCKAQAEVAFVVKDSNNPYFKSKYANLESVMFEFKKVFPKYGLSVVQTFETNIERPEVMMLKTTLMHSSGQWINGLQSVVPVSSKPQDVMSASTYARRYGLQAITGMVSTDEDDDGNAASGKSAQETVRMPLAKPKATLSAMAANPSKIDEIVPTSATHNTDTGIYMFRTDKGKEYFTKSEVVARLVRDSLHKKIRVKVGCDTDMRLIIQEVV